MFCPKCGAQNPDGAAFCGSCGGSFGARKPEVGAAQAVPTSTPVAGGTSVVAKGGLQNPKLVAMAGAVVLILLIVLIRLFACSGGGVNLVDVVNKPTGEVANILKGQKEVVASGYTYFANDENFVRQMSDGSAFDEGLAKYNGDYVFQPENSSGALSLEKISNGSNPTRVEYYLVIAGDKLSAKDVADRVAAVAPYDKVVAYSYSSDGSISGMSKGNGCVSDFYARKYDGAWFLILTTYSIGEDSSGSSYSEDFDDEYEDFDASNYADSYRK